MDVRDAAVFFLQDLRVGPGTAAHQRRVDKLVVAAAAVAEAKVQATPEDETRQAAFQAIEEARMRGVRRARARTDKARVLGLQHTARGRRT